MAITTVDANRAGSTNPEGSKRLALAAAKTAAENNGQDIAILDLRKITPIFDYFVVVTGRSGRQLRAIADEIDQKLRVEMGDRRQNIEGYQESRWIVLDHGDVVVHLLTEEARDFYRLEDLWADAVRVEFKP